MNGPMPPQPPTTHQQMGHQTKRRASVFVAAGLAMLALGACGSDDEADGAAPTTATDGSAPDSIAGPVSTVPADLPDYLVGEIGALDVAGEALPTFGGDTASDPAIGLPAPVLVGTDFAGNAVRVDAAADGPTMLVFLAHWCPVCDAEVPVLNELRDANSFPEDLNIIAVSTAVSPDRPNFPPSEWLKDADWTYPAIADGVDMAAGTFIGPAVYGLDAFPFMVLIDADGNVAARWSGATPGDQITNNIATYLS